MYSSKLLAKCLVAAAFMAPTALLADNTPGTTTPMQQGQGMMQKGGDQSGELMRLKEENRRLKEENDRLKKQIEEMRKRSSQGGGQMQKPSSGMQ